VKVRGLTSRTPAQSRNGDGIGIDCCEHVTVSDCRIATGDDALTLRANTAALGFDKPCRHVTVSDCVLSSTTCAIRVGVGDGVVRDCAISGVVVPAARTGVSVRNSLLRAAADGGAAIHLRRAGDVAISCCQAGEGTFLRMKESPRGARVCMIGNDLARAATAVETDAEIRQAGNL